MNLDNVEFKNEKRFLSNMWPCDIVFGEKGEPLGIGDIICTGLTYKSSEHLYQSLKCKHINWHLFLDKLSPTGTKSAARKHLKTLIADNIDTFLLRDDFHDIKFALMNYIVSQKFIQNPDLKLKLNNIKGHIEEKNDWNDTYWGTYNGYGENNLGKILMKVRNYDINADLKKQLKIDKILTSDLLASPDRTYFEYDESFKDPYRYINVDGFSSPIYSSIYYFSFRKVKITSGKILSAHE